MSDEDLLPLTQGRIEVGQRADLRREIFHDVIMKVFRFQLSPKTFAGLQEVLESRQASVHVL